MWNWGKWQTPSWENRRARIIVRRDRRWGKDEWWNFLCSGVCVVSTYSLYRVCVWICLSKHVNGWSQYDSFIHSLLSIWIWKHNVNYFLNQIYTGCVLKAKRNSQCQQQRTIMSKEKNDSDFSPVDMGWLQPSDLQLPPMPPQAIWHKSFHFQHRMLPFFGCCSTLDWNCP